MPSMTLPANDAFTLGLTGSHDPSRPAYSLSFRSTSPKIPFVSSSKSSYSSGHPPKSPRQTRRSMSNGVPNGAPNGNGNGNHYSSESNTRRRTRTEQTSRTVAIKSESTALVKKQKDQAVDWEIPRKTLHSSIGASKSYPYLESPNNLDTLSPLFTGFLTLYLYTSHGSPKPVIVSLSLALAVIVPADILRLNFPWFERIYERCLGFLMRESEKKSTNGVIWYIIGVVFVLALYPLDVAIVSILILSWADTAASTFGRMFGRYTPPLPRRVPILGIPFAPRKSLAGFIAGSLAGAAVAAGFWGWIARWGISSRSGHWSQVARYTL
ncbi:hypothetical protein NLI96_g330 [Meripilus lineatus]|uniref:Phosphatidate cytidylyltransferase n=1 Tax=Meripilus lineatus TaxID=2056292 RepID=A0AAD5VI98_9APHY|nr:hypothetical protein NLI96_g330 [Physisporinus lineatus]